jgi:hypothetical protein
VDRIDDDESVRSSSSGNHKKTGERHTMSTTTTNRHTLDAIRYAQSVEHAAFNMLNLSIQELLDCDKSADQGCVVS